MRLHPAAFDWLLNAIFSRERQAGMGTWLPCQKSGCQRSLEVMMDEEQELERFTRGDHEQRKWKGERARVCCVTQAGGKEVADKACEQAVSAWWVA